MAGGEPARTLPSVAGMGSRPARRSAAHEEAVARRLELLGAELAGFRGDDESTHTRVRPGTGPRTRPRARRCRVPGRHASRGRLTLGPAQLAVVAGLVVAALVAGAWWLMGGRSSEVAVPDAPSTTRELVSLEPSEAASTSAASGSVTVDVAGRVRRPGIAVLDAGSRVVDALKAAGGARGGVDLTGLNLARVLVDGEQILVGVDPPAGVAAGVSATAAPSATLVNLNTADQVALESLPEVGPVTAQAILAYRTEHGAFTSVDQLLDVDGIGEATLAQVDAVRDVVNDGVRATDLRMPLLGLAAWAGSLLTGAPWVVALLVLVPLVLAGLGRPQAAWTAVGMVVVCSAVLGVALARAQAVRDGPVAEAARARALATLTGTVAGDPRTVAGQVRPAGTRPGGRSAGTSQCWCSVTTTGGGSRWGSGSGSRAGSGPPTTATWPRWSRRAGRPRCSGGPAWPGGRPRRCGRRSATPWRTGPRPSGRWCRPWWTATTPRCPTSWPPTSAPPGSPT